MATARIVGGLRNVILVETGKAVRAIGGNLIAVETKATTRKSTLTTTGAG